MFENTRTGSNDPLDRLPSAPEGSKKADENRLDSEEMVALHGDLMSTYRQELDRQYENRVDQSIDEDYYDHIQIDDVTMRELQERGQAPIVYNVTAQTCNWIIGSEKRGRNDFKILPRRKDDSQSAERKTSVLKYLSDVNNTPFHRSSAFEDAVKVGIGWLEDAVEYDNDVEPIYSRYESWRNMLWDSSSVEPDLSDARYVIRSKWVDADIAKTLAPDRKALIEASCEDGIRFGYDNNYGDEIMDQQEVELDDALRHPTSFNNRQRVRVVEMWFRKPVRVQKFVSGEFRGEILDKNNPHPVHMELIAEAEQEGKQILADRTAMQMHVAIMTVKGLLYVGPSPYRHNEFPFTPVWGYRRGRNRLPYGVIRGIRDIQDDINKRASKNQYILNTNKVIMDEGAVEDLDEFAKEVSRPDAIIVKRQGKSLDINVDRNLAPAHVDMMSRNISMIQSVSGVTDELLGKTTNATSGRAIGLRQEQGSLTTSKLFDNLLFAFRIQGAKQLSLVEQFMTDQKEFRITNMRGTPEFVSVNDGLPENDIVRQKADFVVSETEWRATLRQAQFEQMMEMLTRMPPQVGMAVLDLVVELSDLPNREELVTRIRQINGMSDPDADPESPEEQQRKQAMAQQAAVQQAIAELEMRSKAAKASKDEADAQKSLASIKKIASDIAAQGMETQANAISAAVDAIMNPAAIPVADGLLHEGGFTSRTEEEEFAAKAEADQQLKAAKEEEAARNSTAPNGVTP